VTPVQAENSVTELSARQFNRPAPPLYFSQKGEPLNERLVCREEATTHQCSGCRHRLPREICGNPASQNHGQHIEQTQSCPHFTLNPAAHFQNEALVGSATEDQCSKATAVMWEHAIQLGLPEDDEVDARFFLADCYGSLSQEYGGIEGDMYSAGLEHLEYAAALDLRGRYGIFCQPLNRVRLLQFDGAYTYKANEIEQKLGPNAAIEYLEKKLAVFSPASAESMVCMMLKLSALYYDGRRDSDKAKAYLKRILCSQPLPGPRHELFENAKEKARTNLEFLERCDFCKAASGDDAGRAIASLALSAIGTVLWFLPFVSLPVTLVGLIMGIIALRSPKHGIAVGAIVLSIIGLALSVTSGAIGLAASIR
jgi:hypothetical protein